MNQQPTYRCIIIDDEPIAIRVIENHLKSFSQFECRGGFTRAVDALTLLNSEKIELLFLDIHMPEVSGLDFLKALPSPPKVIFTTAYRNFAVDAFELDAVDYLMKPIAFDRFMKAINKFLGQAEEHQVSHTVQDAKRESIILKVDKKSYKVLLSNILYVESMDNYIKVHTNNGTLICYESLSGVEERLPGSLFLRIHRSFIINVERLELFTNSYLKINNQDLPIGRGYKKDVLNRLNTNG
ncbi:MAG TPA: LytTR family DNA-binding domain-containing protein [Bacteroidales bacterium]|nr:LytTR family DNA-binding domain-containing protein [Bacteroidales bacterium]